MTSNCLPSLLRAIKPVNRSLILGRSQLTGCKQVIYCSQCKNSDDRYKIITVPNTLSIGRIVATPIIGYLIVNQQYTIAFSCFIVAGITDMLDGCIARNFRGQKSLLGSVLDPLADKLLISVMFISLSTAGLISTPLTSIVLLRDILLISGGVYMRYKTIEPPYSIKRFFNPEVSSVQIVPSTISKINTVLQLAVIGFSLANPVFEFGLAYQNALQALDWVTAATTVFSGLQYANGNAIKKL